MGTKMFKRIFKKIDKILVKFVGLDSVQPQYIQSNNNNVSIICVRAGDRFLEKKSFNQFIKEKDSIQPETIKKCGKAIAKSLASELVIEFE